MGERASARDRFRFVAGAVGIGVFGRLLVAARLGTGGTVTPTDVGLGVASGLAIAGAGTWLELRETADLPLLGPRLAHVVLGVVAVLVVGVLPPTAVIACGLTLVPAGIGGQALVYFQ
jgi:hypothetical protein